jgi:hypothetical protein
MGCEFVELWEWTGDRFLLRFVEEAVVWDDVADLGLKYDSVEDVVDELSIRRLFRTPETVLFR